MITYKQGRVDVEPVVELLRASGMNRPVDDMNRIQRMLEGADLILTAWDADRLIGLVRAISDFSWTTYINEVAVHPNYQRQGIGRELLERVFATSSEARYVLHSVEGAEGFYERLGFLPLVNVYMKPRIR